MFSKIKFFFIILSFFSLIGCGENETTNTIIKETGDKMTHEATLERGYDFQSFESDLLAGASTIKIKNTFDHPLVIKVDKGDLEIGTKEASDAGADIIFIAPVTSSIFESFEEQSGSFTVEILSSLFQAEDDGEFFTVTEFEESQSDTSFLLFYHFDQPAKVKIENADIILALFDKNGRIVRWFDYDYPNIYEDIFIFPQEYVEKKYILGIYSYEINAEILISTGSELEDSVTLSD